MLGPDQNISDFPVWILPYIDIARLSQSNINESFVTRVPTAVVNAHVSALLSAVSMQQFASRLPDKALGKQFSSAAASAVAEIIDDICGTRPPHPFPWPPHHLVLEVAAQIATAAAGTDIKGTKTHLGQIAAKLSERAREMSAGITSVRMPGAPVAQ